MSETPTRSGPTALTTSSATIKTAGGASTWTVIRSILISNITTVSATVTVGVGTSNTDTAAKRIANAMPVGAGQTIELIAPGFLTLVGDGSTPDLLYALASANSSLNITVSQIDGP